MAEFTGKGQGNLNTVLGAIGTAGATGLFGGNGMGSIFGGGDYVSQKEMSLSMENALYKAKDEYNGILLGLYDRIDSKVGIVDARLDRFEREQREINSAQAVTNGLNTATMQCMQGNIATLMGMTKTVIPNSSICPGWGNANVSVSTGTTTG